VSLTLLFRKNPVLFLAAVALCGAPLPVQQQPPRFIQIAEDFSRGSGGWLAEFSDYELTQGGLGRLAEIRSLPEETGVEGSGYYLQGINPKNLCEKSGLATSRDPASSSLRCDNGRKQVFPQPESRNPGLPSTRLSLLVLYPRPLR